MAAADRTNNTEQLQRFINNLWQHQQKNELCDFTLTTNNTAIRCHTLVLSSASSYFSQLLNHSEHNTTVIDVTPLPGHILRTVAAFMYNSEYVIGDENVIELLKLSGSWNLDILAKLCVTYMHDNITTNNASMFYNFALDNVDQHKSQIANEFIREHSTSLHESGQLSELSLKSFTTIIEHDEINVKNEDVIFSSAVQIINQRTSVEDINRCLELIRFPHTSENFFANVIRKHPLMKDPPRDRYVSEATLYQTNKTLRPEVKPTRNLRRSCQGNRTLRPEVNPPRYWGRSRIYYLGKDHIMYQYAPETCSNEGVEIMGVPGWVDIGSSVDLHKKRAVIWGGENNLHGEKRALLIDMADNIQVTQLPDLPEARRCTGVVLSDKDVYVVGGVNNRTGCLSSVYCLSLGSDEWQTKSSMPYEVQSPLVIQHQQCIYVLGGCNIFHQPNVSRYNIEDDTWKRCRNIPEGCDSDVAGVVVHEGRIKVFTEDKCLMYADDTDTWTVTQYDKLGDAVKAFVRKGQICAVVRSDDTFSMMSYDDVDNVWETEHERIDNAWEMRFFF